LPAVHAAVILGMIGSAQLDPSSQGGLALHAAFALAAQARVPATYSPHLVQQPTVASRGAPTMSQSASVVQATSSGG
jgi:hypothetical protein